MTQVLEPAWLRAARADLGLKEIVGARHAPRILQMLAFLSYPFRDDETAWCGTAMAAWFKQVGIAPPKAGYRALNWATWGRRVEAQVGGVGVKQRKGGNHVFLIVGITADGRFYKALGGNQRNSVCIMDIAVAETFAIRWPEGWAERHIPLPVVAAGTVSSNEA